MPVSQLCNKETLVQILDSLDIGLIFVDEENNITFINKSAEQIRRMKSTERIGTSILECHGGKMKERVLEVMRDFENGICISRHKMIRTKDKYFDNIYNLVKDENGNFIGVVLSTQDVTEKKELEEKLKQANEELEEKIKQRTNEIEKAYEQIKIAQQQLMQSEKMAAIGQFVAGLAHEINNPLDGIQNCLQAILSDPTDIEQTKNYAKLSKEGLYKIEMLVRKLLSYARIHSLEKSDVDINYLLEGILSLTALKLKNKGIEVRKELNSKLPYIFGDPHYLEQIFVNLILNAYDAMQYGGKLTVKTFVNDEGFIIIKVIDTGQGIPKEFLTKIFEPFFTTKQKSNGTGLGLYLSYNFVYQHGGRISVRSEKGKGTEFMVVFPPTNLVEEQKTTMNEILSL